MNFEKLQSSGAYDQVSKVIGRPIAINILNRTVEILADEYKTVIAKLEDVTFLEVVGSLNGVSIVEGDVLSGGGQNYEVELSNNRQDIVLYTLDAKLERVEKGESFDKNTLESLSDLVELIGNIYELRNDLSVVDFNIRVVRHCADGETTYYYACNNKETEEVEMIKVIYVGHMLLEEELYERDNLSYDDYLALLTSNEYKEVSPSELGNYVLGMTHRPTAPTPAPQVEVEAEDLSLALASYNGNSGKEATTVEDEGYCDECGDSEEDCDCQSWDI